MSYQEQLRNSDYSIDIQIRDKKRNVSPTFISGAAGSLDEVREVLHMALAKLTNESQKEKHEQA